MHGSPASTAEAPAAPKSAISEVWAGFRHLPLAERRQRLAQIARTDADALAALLDSGGIDMGTADRMIENAIGKLAIPFGVALHFRMNGEDRLVPMATEEPSVVAAASHAAKRVREGGGFTASVTEPIMIAQVEVHDVPDAAAAITRIQGAEAELLRIANDAVPTLTERGGGARHISVRSLGEGFVVTHVHVDCREAMGANLVNTVAEAVGARVADLAGGELGLRILSNYCDERLTRVTAKIPLAALACSRVEGPAAARGIALASRFAELDPYRAVTHNKGAMNGIDAVVLATGNDFRAVEAAAHAHAARSGAYRPLATWRLDEAGAHLIGAIEIPLAVGAIGGALRAHGGARLALALAEVRSSSDLAMLAAAAGLASNLAALRALATEGIQRGHMRLHRRALP